MRQRILFLIFSAVLIPVSVCAQNNGWIAVDNNTKELATTKKEVKAAKANREERDKPYLLGMVPEVDGLVTFARTFEVPGKTARELYELIYGQVDALTKEDGQISSHIVLKNDQEHSFAARFNEWMVFSQHILAVDRTEFHYSMIVNCEDGRFTVSMNHLSYIHSDSKTDNADGWKANKLASGQAYRAEEWITDKEAVNKKGTRLLRFSRKYRIKTIDRMNELFSRFSSLA